MARPITRNLEAESLAKELSPFILFEGAFEGGSLRLWSGLGTLLWNGQEWTGAGNLINMSPIIESQDVTAPVTRVELNGMNAAVVALAQGDNYQGRLAKVYIGAIDTGPDSTNDIHNNTMQGAVVGTIGSGGALPTGWNLGFNSANFSIDVVGFGTEDGLEYIDIRYYNPTAVGQVNQDIGGITDIAAMNGNNRVMSCYVTRVGGSEAGFVSLRLTHSFFNSVSSFIDSNSGALLFPLSTGPLSENRFIFADTVNEVGTVSTLPELPMTNSVITTPDLTLRIGLPQDESGTEATPPIRTFGTPVTRTRIVADPHLLFEGRMDVMEIDETGETASISMTIESRLVDLDRTREWRYTSELQKQLFPGDLGLEFIPFLQDKQITWGAG